MSDLIFTSWLSAYRSWGAAATALAWEPWRLLGAHYQATLKALGELAPATPPEPTAGSPQDLEQQAVERVRRGLAPRREIYDAQNRGRIDWLKLPEWARPCDPELFGECPHEG
jgi:hypothetical protein